MNGVRRRIDRAININEVCDVNPFGVIATIAAYNEGGAWLDALRKYLWENYEYLCRFFEQRLPQYPVLPLEGTYLVWIDCRASSIGSDATTLRLQEEQKLMVNFWYTVRSWWRGVHSSEYSLSPDVACRRPGTDSPCVGTKFLREFCQTLNWQQPPANLIIDDNTKVGPRNRQKYGLGSIGEDRCGNG